MIKILIKFTPKFYELVNVVFKTSPEVLKSLQLLEELMVKQLLLKQLKIE